MKRALVLGGGGSLGAYELGAWRALRDMDVEFHMVTGTSIGAINAALIAQGDYDLVDRLWSTVTVDHVMVDGINMYTEIEKYLNQRTELRAFLRRYAKNRGADISPLVDLVTKSVDERRVRASKLELGLVAVEFPTLSPLELMLPDIPDGQLVDYLMASAACFPAFPVYHIGDKGYIDGGYYDNLPVNLALKNGADEVIAIDLFGTPAHPTMVGRPWMTFVQPSRALGPILMFDREVLDRNILLGELDTLRAFGRVLGRRYSFDAASAAPHEGKARAFSIATAMLDDRIGFRRAVTRKVSGAPVSGALLSALPEGRSTSIDELLIGAELIADLLDIDPYRLYSLDEFNALLLGSLPLADAGDWVRSASPADHMGIHRLDRALSISVLALLLNDGGIADQALRAAARRPEDLVAASYIRLFL